MVSAGRKQGARAAAGGSALPDLRSQEAVQSFFLQEVQLGEELLAQGSLEEGVEHLCNAVAVCHQPQQLLQVLQQTVPPQVFQLLLQRLPLAGQVRSRHGTACTALTTGRYTQIDRNIEVSWM